MGIHPDLSGSPLGRVMHNRYSICTVSGNQDVPIWHFSKYLMSVTSIYYIYRKVLNRSITRTQSRFKYSPILQFLDSIEFRFEYCPNLNWVKILDFCLDCSTDDCTEYLCKNCVAAHKNVRLMQNYQISTHFYSKNV